MKPTSPGGHGPEGLHNEGVAHEESDVNIRAILAFGGVVVVVTIVCAVIVWGLFDVLESQAAGRDPKRSPLAMTAPEMPRTTAAPFFGTAPAPQLITSEPAVLQMLRRTEDAQLHQYGWIDQKGGVARVPIDQAKKVLAERGLPSRPDASGAVDPRLGTHAPAFGESNGGRTIPTGERVPDTTQAPRQQETAPAAPRPANEQPAHAPSGRGGGA